MKKRIEKIYKIAIVNGFPNLAHIIYMAIENNNAETFQTNGIDVFYNNEFMKKLTIKEALAVFAHEYYHIIYDHINRRGSRDPLIWNLAADVVVNDSVENRMGMALPDNAIKRGRGTFELLPLELKTSTKIYNWLMQNRKYITESDQKLAEDDIIETEKIILLGGSKQTNKNLQKLEALNGQQNDELREAMTGTTNIDVDWIDLVKAVQIESGRLVHRINKRSFSRPARFESKGLIRPCLKKYQRRPKVDVYIDVSGSMGDNPNIIFNGLKTILNKLVIYQPRFFRFDTKINEINIKDRDILIGGGTDIRNVLNKINKDKADLAILITDCQDNISKEDIKSNVVIVSDNYNMSDYYTSNWKTVRKMKGN